MEITLQTRLARFSMGMRVAFWRSVSACIAAFMRAPTSLKLILTSLPLLMLGSMAYVLGRAAGNLLSIYLH